MTKQEKKAAYTMEAAEKAAEECRVAWCEMHRHLVDEKTYQENKDTMGRLVIPYAFKAGMEYGISLERERTKTLEEAIEMYIDRAWPGEKMGREALAKYRGEE